ncbi:MAG: GNAT family N-acetyltransferase [Deltaproteobacteria bacterium]|nr:MAG: GNAT family N-acetyltransferase [Deltaproteobacteria bacterium]
MDSPLSSHPRDLPDAPLELSVLGDIASVEVIAPEWDALLDRTACNRAFGSAAFYLATATAFSATPRPIAARRAGRLVGLFPLFATSSGLGLLRDFADHKDMLVEPGDDAAARALLVRALDETGGGTLVLRNLHERSTCARLVAAGLDDLGCSVTRLADVPSCQARLAPGEAPYAAALSHNLRATVRRALRRAAERGVTVGELHPGSYDPAALPDRFLRLHAERLGPDTTLSRDVGRAFLRAALPQLFTQRRLRVMALRDGERVIAIDLCMVGARSLCTWNTGFVADAEPLSPGHLLFHAELELARALGLAELDFLSGDQPYKVRWANASSRIIAFELRALTAGRGRGAR